MPSILPPMTPDESLDVTAIYSIAGLLGSAPRILHQRPFRSPHHTCSRIALVGGGTNPRPGEVTLASRGVLYLDEIAEFPRATLEVLRQPLEDGTVTIARAAGSCTFPARFSLVASMNPCPCGQRGERNADCRCDDAAVARYRGRISGPLLDRIDLHVNVVRVPYGELSGQGQSETSSTIRARVIAARDRQRKRNGSVNAQLRGNDLRVHAALDTPSSELLEGGDAARTPQRAQLRPHRARRANDRRPRGNRTARARPCRRGVALPANLGGGSSRMGRNAKRGLIRVSAAPCGRLHLSFLAACGGGGGASVAPQTGTASGAPR